MKADKNMGKITYIIVGIGAPGTYVIEHLHSSYGDNSSISFHTFRSFSEFRMDAIVFAEETQALFLVLQPGDRVGDVFIPELEYFIMNTGIPVYVLANYPFLWEGHIRIGSADKLLHELSRICNATFRIESHQWFPLKEHLGFHKVVELVHQVATDLLVSILENRTQGIDIHALERISIGENVEATKQAGGLWIVSRNL